MCVCEVLDECWGNGVLFPSRFAYCTDSVEDLYQWWYYGGRCTWERMVCYDFSPSSEFLIDEVFDLVELFD